MARARVNDAPVSKVQDFTVLFTLKIRASLISSVALANYFSSYLSGFFFCTRQSILRCLVCHSSNVLCLCFWIWFASICWLLQYWPTFILGVQNWSLFGANSLMWILHTRLDLSYHGISKSSSLENHSQQWWNHSNSQAKKINGVRLLFNHQNE